MRGVLRTGLPFRAALEVALSADTLSITVMGLVDNGVMVAVPGAMEAGLASVLFWGALAFALAVAFVVTLPVNRWLMSRGRGHAVVHTMHWGRTPLWGLRRQRPRPPSRRAGSRVRWCGCSAAVRDGQQLVAQGGTGRTESRALHSPAGTRGLSTLTPGGHGAHAALRGCRRWNQHL